MPRKALVVDDQDTVRALVRACLEREHGCEVVEAASGLAAVRVLVEQAVDVVVTDFDMPEMTGLELVGFIKSDPEFAAIPVIMLSSHSEQLDRKKVLDFGVQAFLEKPFTADGLRPHLLAVLSRS